MAICPKCKAEFDHLYCTAMAVIQGDFSLKEATAWEIATIDHDTYDFRCPVCDKILFKSKEEATRFLESK